MDLFALVRLLVESANGMNEPELGSLPESKLGGAANQRDVPGLVIDGANQLTPGFLRIGSDLAGVRRGPHRTLCIMQNLGRNRAQQQAPEGSVAMVGSMIKSAFF